MQLFVRIPPSSQPTRRRTGGPNARNILHLVSLLNNGKPEFRRRLRRSRLVVVPKTKTKKRMTMSNWYSSLYFEYIIGLMSCTLVAVLRSCLFTPPSAHDMIRTLHSGNVLLVAGAYAPAN